MNTPNDASDTAINRLVDLEAAVGLEGARAARAGLDADAVIEAQLEYLRSGGKVSKRRLKLENRLTSLLVKLDNSEAAMRRSFKRWDGYRTLVRSTERLLDALAKEEGR